jgi:hypothetical protein
MPLQDIDVFVSYKREDRQRVAPLVQCLRSAGLGAWWDADIPGGSTWRPEILRHLEGARCVVVVWSELSVSLGGEFVHEEASQAKRRGTLLPVTIDAVSPPLGFGEIQSLDLTGWTGDPDDVRVASVIETARAKVVGGPPPAPIAQRRRKRRLAGALALAFPTIGFLANIASLQSVVCTAPGIRAACGTLGFGGVPTAAEEREWASRPIGDCVWLREFLARHSKGALGVQVGRLLQASRTVVEESWQPEEQREPIHVSPALAGFPTIRAAQADAIVRGEQVAVSACGGFATGAYRVRSTRIAADSIQWECTRYADGTRCGFDAQAICAVDARHAVTREVCDAGR